MQKKKFHQYLNWPGARHGEGATGRRGSSSDRRPGNPARPRPRRQPK